MTSNSWLAFSIDRSSGIPIFEQICQAIRTRANSGMLTSGTRMPPTRVFATELGVSRSTVVTAYEQLVAECYLRGIQGSGYEVCTMSTVELPSPPPTNTPIQAPSARSAPISFEGGEPDMRLFPHRQWAKTVARICRSDPMAMLSADDIFGNMKLRRAIAAHIREWRGIDATPHQIVVTAGATDALEICMRALTQPGDAIGLEDPGYPPLRHFSQAQGLLPRFLPLDPSGATLPDPAHDVRLVILTPSHQYPMGGAMTPLRRMAFLQWAQQHAGWIIEDDYDSEFRYAGRPIPAMAGFDHLSRTLYIGSFSKIFSNGLRMGYLVVPDPLIDRFRATVRRFGVRASAMPQQPLADFMHSGEFYRHLRRVRRIYGERRKFLLDQLTNTFGPYGSCRDHQAGMQIVFHLESSTDDRTIAKLAYKRGLKLRALSEFTVQHCGQSGLVLGFCAMTEQEMGLALVTLEDILKGQIRI